MMLIVPRTLSGFKDRLPEESMKKSKLLRIVSEVFENFGFVSIETPHIEYADILVKQGGEDIQKELYRFKDHGGRDVALRFDQTVPLARFISQYKNEVDLPFKRYVIGNVFRGERAQRGRYREFTQCDFDFIGSGSISCDVEVVQVIYRSMIALGIEEFTIWLNHREILNGICKHYGIKEKNGIESVLRIVDKLEKIGREEVLKELSKLLGFESEKIDSLLESIEIKQNGTIDEFFQEIEHMKGWNEELKRGIENLESVFGILKELEMDIDTCRVNFSIARGLGYYTGIVYETTLNRIKSIGSVCSGGRYDDLTRTFSKDKMSGVGASIGIDRLLAALEELKLLDHKGTPARVLIACMSSEYFGFAHKIAESMRRSRVSIEVYPEASKLKKQFGYADSKGHEFVIVIGEEEFTTKTITLKNMTSGMQINGLSFLKALELIKE